MGAPGTEFTPGLHVVRDHDPARRASEVARSLGVTVRSSPTAVDELVASLPASPMTDDDLDRMEALAARLSRVAAVEDRTLSKASTSVGERLTQASGGLAIHPATVRERASALQAARMALVETERAIAEHEADAAPPELGQPDEGVASSTSDAPAPPQGREGPSMRTRQSRAIGTVVGSFGLALVLLAVGAVALWAALVPPLAAALWASWYLRDRGAGHQGQAEDELGVSRLAEVAEATDAAFGISLQHEDQHELDRLLAKRMAAEEEARVAERAWRDLAGPDTDIDEVEAVVQRFDSQHVDGRVLAVVTVQVRAAKAVRERLEGQWADEWRALGQDPPPSSESVTAVATLRSRLSRPAVLTGSSATEVRRLAAILDRVPVVLVQPPVTADASGSQGDDAPGGGDAVLPGPGAQQQLTIPNLAVEEPVPDEPGAEAAGRDQPGVS